MRTRVLSEYAALLCLLAVLGGCPPRPPARGPQKAKVDETATRLRQCEELLRMVPASASGVLLLDIRGLYGAWQDVERAVRQSEEGRLQLEKARASLSRGPVAFPFTTGALRGLGIDPSRPAMMYGEGDHFVALFHVHDEGKLRETMVRGERDKTVKWIKKTSRGRTFHQLGKEFCHSQSGRMICASREDLLHIALQHRPERSVWHALTPAGRKDLARAAAVYFLKDKEIGITGALRVERDGLSTAFRVEGDVWDTIARWYEGLKPRYVLGLARGGSTQMYWRMNLGAMLDQFAEKGALGALKTVGLAPEKLRKGLTGELLLVERPGGELALILGCRDPGLTRMLTALAATAIQQVSRNTRHQAVAVDVSQVPGSAGSDVRIHVKSTHTDLPLDIKVRLKAGKAGLFVGTEKLVLALADQEPPPVTRFTSTLETPSDRQAFGPRTAMGLRTGLGDPLELAATFLPVDRLVQMGKLDARTRRTLDLVRLLTDQLHSATMGMASDGTGGMRLVLRVHTLHQRGAAGADAARKLWYRGVQAKLAGKKAAYRAVLEQLAAKHRGTRYGGLLQRRTTGGGASYAALTSVLAAVAIPAFLKYIRKSRTVEAYGSLDKITAGARVYYRADHYDNNGNLLPHRFPPSVPLTPSGGPPCGKTATTPQATWDRQGWRALNFSVTGPSRYAYSFTSSGSGKASTFRAQAHADLDCDGKLSTFEVKGLVNRAGEVQLIGPIVENELE